QGPTDWPISVWSSPSLAMLAESEDFVWLLDFSGSSVVAYLGYLRQQGASFEGTFSTDGTASVSLVTATYRSSDTLDLTAIDLGAPSRALTVNYVPGFDSPAEISSVTGSYQHPSG